MKLPSKKNCLLGELQKHQFAPSRIYNVDDIT